MSHAFGLSLDRHPTPWLIERHNTASWGYRWDCRKCGGRGTRYPTESDALEAIRAHKCESPRSVTNVSTSTAPITRWPHHRGTYLERLPR